MAEDTLHVPGLQQMAGGHGGARDGERGRHLELGRAKQIGRPPPALILKKDGQGNVVLRGHSQMTLQHLTTNGDLKS